MQSSDRLDRIEAMLELVGQRNVEADQRLTRIEALAEQNAQSFQRHDAAIQRHDEGIQRHDAAMQRHNEAMQRHDEAMQRHDAALDRIDARLDRAAQIVDSNARAIEAWHQSLDDAIEAEREEAMGSEELFENRLDDFGNELRALRISTSEDLSALRRSVDSLRESQIRFFDFFREEIGRIWEQIRAS